MEEFSAVWWNNLVKEPRRRPFLFWNGWLVLSELSNHTRFRTASSFTHKTSTSTKGQGSRTDFLSYANHLLRQVQRIRSTSSTIPQRSMCSICSHSSICDFTQIVTSNFADLYDHRYVLHSTSGPFLKHHQAHYNLSLSCMNYLITSECFINESTTPNERTLRVLKGFHGLHQYANEFWFQHLLQYAKFGIVIDEYRLEELLDEIRVFWKEEPGNGTRSLTLEDKNYPDRIEAELEVLNTLPQAQSMLLDLLRFRQFLLQEKYVHQKAESELCPD